MTPELTALALAALLQAVQFVSFASLANRDLTPGYTTSPRDRPPSRQMTVTTARLQRALNNHFEGLILFTIAVLVVTLGDQSTPLTRTCAWIYLAARVAYIPAYALGLVPWRSVVWVAGFGATLLMILTSLV